MENVNLTSATGDALVERIKSGGRAEAEKIISDAEKYAEETIAAATRQAAEYAEKQRLSAETAANDILRGKRTLGAIEEKKILLGAKQSIVETVYLRVVQKLNKTTKAEFLALADRLISKYAERGETAVLAANCPASAEEVEALASAKALGIKATGGGKFNGGIVLSGKTCDKDLSFAALCAAARESTEAEVAAELFG